MLTSDFRSCNHSLPLKGQDEGFTLIEILVVLLIVTVMAGVTVANLPGFVRTADLDTEARRIELLFNMLRTEAMLDSREFGFRPTTSGYEFVSFDDAAGAWRTAVSPFQPRTLPDGLRLIVRADNDGLEGFGEGLPPILVLSSGETTPFDVILEIKGSDDSRTLSTDGYGEFEWQDEDT